MKNDLTRAEWLALASFLENPHKPFVSHGERRCHKGHERIEQNQSDETAAYQGRKAIAPEHIAQNVGAHGQDAAQNPKTYAHGSDKIHGNTSKHKTL